MIHLQPLQAARKHFEEVRLDFCGAVSLRRILPRPATKAGRQHFGGNDHVVANAHLLDHVAHHLLVAALLVVGRRIKMTNPKIVTAANQPRHVRVHHAHAHHRQRNARLAQGAANDFSAARKSVSSHRLPQKIIGASQQLRGSQHRSRLCNKLSTIPRTNFLHGILPCHLKQTRKLRSEPYCSPLVSSFNNAPASLVGLSSNTR